MNGGGGYDYYAYYDYYGDYPEPHYGYGRPQGKRNFHERDGRPSPAKLEKEKSRDKEEEEEPSLEDDFVSSRLKANLTLMLLVANLANTKWCKTPENWLKLWHMGRGLAAYASSVSFGHPEHCFLTVWTPKIFCQVC